MVVANARASGMDELQNGGPLIHPNRSLAQRMANPSWSTKTCRLTGVTSNQSELLPAS